MENKVEVNGLDKVMFAALDQIGREEPESASAAEELKVFLAGDGSVDEKANRFGLLCIVIAECVRLDPKLLVMLAASAGIRTAVANLGPVPEPEIVNGH